MRPHSMRSLLFLVWPKRRGCSCTATRLVAREVEPPLSEDDSAGLCTSSEDPENAHGDVYAADRAFKRPESAVVHCQEHLDELEVSNL